MRPILKRLARSKTNSCRSSSKCKRSAFRSRRGSPRASVDLFLVALIAVLSGCQTIKPREDITPASKEGAWSAKTLIKDKRKNKSNTVDLDLVARQPGQLRMEVSTSLGFHVASLALSGDTVAYAITREKRYAKGPASPEAMKSLIHVSLDPNVIVNLLFDRTLPRDKWECRLSVQHLPESCVSKDASIKITWSERTHDRRLVQIEAPMADVTLSLREAQSKVQITDALFELLPPEGFRTVPIR